MLDSIKNQRVLVTAGGSGIGMSIAIEFHLKGARVHVCDISEEAISNINKLYPEIGTSITDVGDAKQVASLYEDINSQYDGLDVLINNAGIGGPKVPLDELSDADWDATIGVNLNGTFYCSKHASRIMKEQKSGCIINISTASVRTGLPLRAPYVASKAGVQGLTYNIARELGPYNIRCNAILPGAIDNPRGHALVERRAKELDITIEEAENLRLQYISIRSRIDPREIAESCLFLASDSGRHITGQMLGVCGNSEWEI